MEKKRTAERTLSVPCEGQKGLYLPSERLFFIPEKQDQQLKDIIIVPNQATTSRSSLIEQQSLQTPALNPTQL